MGNFGYLPGGEYSMGTIKWMSNKLVKEQYLISEWLSFNYFQRGNY